ncbi:MAG: glycosyltransferase family 2 protein [Candidatus Bathyarchaeia archaeon]|jgi:hypothetical protein
MKLSVYKRVKRAYQAKGLMYLVHIAVQVMIYWCRLPFRRFYFRTFKRKKRYSIVCICQIYNEIRKGNLERFVKYAKSLFDHLVVWDNASTDGSYEYMVNHASYVFRSEKNDFADEMRIKQILLDYALTLRPDFVMYLDADEVLTADAQSRLQTLCRRCLEDGYDGVSFHELNLWRSRSWRRIDNLYDEGWFVRLWRVTPNISYGEIKRGLHHRPEPETVQRTIRAKGVQVIHYGFASERLLAFKYLVYKSYGQSGYWLDRLIDESTLVLEKVNKELFPEGLYVDDDRPKKLDIQESLAYVDRYRAEVLGDLDKTPT